MLFIDPWSYLDSHFYNSLLPKLECHTCCLLFHNLPPLMHIVLVDVNLHSLFIFSCFSLDPLDNMWGTWWNWGIRWGCINFSRHDKIQVNDSLVWHLVRCFFIPPPHTPPHPPQKKSSYWSSSVKNAGDWPILMSIHLSRKCLWRMVNGFLELLKD